MTTKPAFHIRRPGATEGGVLFEIWRRSVCATHAFLGEDDLQALATQVRELLFVNLDTWVLCPFAADPIGFIVMDRCHIDALFIAPEWIHRGGGSLLLAHARSLHGRLTVDVNGQNSAGLKFYLACGFAVTGRSETDSAGRPFPLLHLAETRPQRS